VYKAINSQPSGNKLVANPRRNEPAPTSRAIVLLTCPSLLRPMLGWVVPAHLGFEVVKFFVKPLFCCGKPITHLFHELFELLVESLLERLKTSIHHVGYPFLKRRQPRLHPGDYTGVHTTILRCLGCLLLLQADYFSTGVVKVGLAHLLVG